MKNYSKLTRILFDVVNSTRAAMRSWFMLWLWSAARVRAGVLSVEEAQDLHTEENYAYVQEENELVYRAAWMISALADGRPTEHIKIAGHVGTWYVVDVKSREYNGHIQPLLLLEHETYGDEAAGLLVDEAYNVILDDVWNGYSDFDEL